MAAARVDLGLMYFRLGTYADIKILIEELTAAEKFEHLEEMIVRGIGLTGSSHFEPDFEIDILNGLSSALFHQKKYQEAEQSMHKLIKLQKVHFGNRHESVAASLANLGTTLYNLQKFQDAEIVQREALTIQKPLLSADSFDVAITKSNLAASLMHSEKFMEAEQLLEEAIPVKRKAKGRSSLAVDLGHYGKALLHRERYRKAEEALTQAIDITEKNMGQDHADVAIILNYLGSSLHMQQKYKQAADAFVRALGLWKQSLSEDSTEIFNLKAALAASLLHDGKFEEARDLFAEILPVLRDSLSSAHPLVSGMTCDLAAARLGCGQSLEAEQTWKEVLPLRASLVGENDHEVGSLMHSIGDSLRAQSKFSDAIEWYTKATHVFRKLIDKNLDVSENLAMTLSAITTAYFDLKDYTMAEATLKTELDIRTRVNGSGHPLVGRVLMLMAHVAEVMGKRKEASQLFSRSLSIVASKNFVDDGTDVGRIAKELGQYFMNRQDYGSACRAFEKYLQVAEGCADSESDGEADALVSLASALCQQQDFVQAEKLCRDSLRLRTKMFGKSSLPVGRTSASLGSILLHQNK